MLSFNEAQERLDGIRLMVPIERLRFLATPTSLVEDIRKNGILIRIIITPTGKVLDGARRLTAASILGIKVVPCTVRVNDISDRRLIEEAVVDNEILKIKRRLSGDT